MKALHCIAFVLISIEILGVGGARLAQAPTSISGIVVDEAGAPVAGATVRVQTTPKATLSDDVGRFTLADLASSTPVKLTAWALGYYIVGGDGYLPGASNVQLMLIKHTEKDNPNYAWLPSRLYTDEGESKGCAECHSRGGTELTFNLPVDDWLMDAHSQTASNIRFLTMYKGTDVNGNQSPLTRRGFNRDYGSFPLPPDPDQPYFGPGYKLDFSGTAGNCAACHTPVAAVNDPYGIDPTSVAGVAAEGVACDFCHKVWGVRLDPATGQPYRNMPGVLSLEFRRPFEDHQFFTGPYDDVAPGEDTYSPLQQESQYCAACHFGFFWDTLVYNSFGEWLDSPYSEPQTGQTCQNCHMPTTGATHFVRSDKGGLERDPETIYSHLMPGAFDEKLLQNALTMEANARLENDQVMVEVRLTNDKTGHHVPTDSPLRHLILLVRATDAQGHPLTQIDGSTVPEWGGIGDSQRGYYAGQPGKAFAKVLEELWTEVSPSGAYWNPTKVLSDNRIAALATDRSSYRFAAPDQGVVQLDITLLYRRAFKKLMDQKGWVVADIVMEQLELTLLVSNKP